MKQSFLWGMSLVLLFGLSACKWRDDFRERKQPEFLELPPEPTLNVDSDQYVGDKVAKEVQGEVIEPDQVIPEIDQRTYIPDLPEHPVGVE